ncbi:hypothetical protein BofuT4_P022890.1 [Botrytis cinerea T4]|uniref:Uncharacterized protein n=1 Tax=Botryotinia fuckeliana (strain T4) TaxID=999810 RepID=G2YGY7_BOTF4|nr:hypothetical protein BofuT4_P022890.1 [Botrytis cinerea T4]
MSWSTPNGSDRWGIDDSYSSPHHQASDPTSAIKEKLNTNKTELLNLKKEIQTKEEAIRIDEKAFEHAKSELNNAEAQLVEETASLVATKGAHDTLVEEIQSQNNYLEAIRGAKSLQQEQQTWEQCLIKENRKLREEVKSLRKLLEDNLNHYNLEVVIVRKDIGVLKFEHQRPKSHCPQTFEYTTFFKVWSRMGKKGFCTKLRALPQQAGFAIRSIHFEWLKSPQGRDITIIEKGSEVANYADALLDAVMFVPELFDNKCETYYDDELYKQTYHHSPIEIISMASCDHSKSLINVINWFARIKQWCTNRDYLRTDFVTENGQLGIYPFTSQKRDWLKLPRWDSILRDLESLYLKEEDMNKRKHQRVDQPTFLKVGKVQVGGQELSSKDTNTAESPVRNRSPAEEISKPSMSRSQYFKD